MKKLSVLATLAVAIMFLGSRATPAHALCIHLANFCDTVQLSNDVIEGGHMFGKWDWMCVGVGTSVSGTKSAKITVGTRPVYGGYTFPYTTDFVFSKATKLFELVATDGNSTFFLRSGEPWTNSGGSCGLAGPHPRFSGPSTVGR